MKKFFGILILSVGLVFLLVNTGLIDTEVTSLFSTFWPAIIVLVGLKILFEGIIYFFHGLRRDRLHIGKIVWGAIVTALGGVLLGNNAGWFQFSLSDLWNWTWPLIIIYIGFKILFDREPSVVIDFGPDQVDKMKKSAQRKKHRTKHKNMNHTGFEDSNTNHRTFMGDISLGRQPWEPDGMNVSMGIGSIELDLTKAILKEGENRIDVSSWVGSVEIYVPKEMAVHAKANVNIGEVTLFDDSHAGTGRNATYTSPGFHDADRKLILHVAVSVGDVEVLTVD
ncbi:hypothetical protein CR194_10165 [Salipaludibacillus keqinensis]|uniref:Cell wall-active antibiotics response LiaF-like C-terminal domain-containing protein n=1 Tax=Salipaludibacillus keqinensis TaxID=2045207 RepID=A0A323THV6_9BACI|nr:cell wall-active antibiotics response protein LiaF [Salipaludibacillus keqinensis]PYZ93524.1 hypothetical protein CR194_10165 [Salipaludibacillus keqinensis]